MRSLFTVFRSIAPPLPWVLAPLLLLGTAVPGQAYGPNLLANPGFDTGLSPWINYFELGTDVWTRSDADGSILSGSLQFTRNHPPNGGLGVAQCIPVAGNTSYVASVKAWIPAGSPANPEAWMVASFFDTVNCGGPGVGSFLIESDTQGKWVELAGKVLTPPNALSARILLINAKDIGADASVRIYFDKAFFGTGTCAPAADRLCLNQGRFQVQATWVTNSGLTGPGMAVPFASDSGSFWFFSPTNIELDVKVLNACVPSLGNHYWFFAAGLTNVEVTLTVTDTLTNVVKTYVNPQNRIFETITDTSAFSTCP